MVREWAATNEGSETIVKVHLHDDRPDIPQTKPSPHGPTHLATITCDYEYQVEQAVIDAQADLQVVRVDCPDLGRYWKRVDGRLVEVAPGQP